MHLFTDFKIFIVRTISFILAVGAVPLVILGPGYCTKTATHLGLIRRCGHFFPFVWNFKSYITYLHLSILLLGIFIGFYNFCGFFSYTILKKRRTLMTVYLCIAGYFICGIGEIVLFLDVTDTFTDFTFTKLVRGKIFGYLGAGIIYFFAGLLTIYDSSLYKVVLAD